MTPRRYGQWALTILFVVLMVLVAGYLWQHKSDRVEVLELRADVPPGHSLSRGDLVAAEVSGVADAVAVTDLNEVLGRTATVGLVRGQILTRRMVTTREVPAAGERLVGLQLDAARAPQGLGPGDSVTILEAPPAGDPGSPESLAAARILAGKATVERVSRLQNGVTRIAVLVPSSSANDVAEYGAASRLTLVQAPVGGDD